MSLISEIMGIKDDILSQNADTLCTNYLAEDSDPLSVSAIKPSILAFQEILSRLDSEALEFLPSYRLKDLNQGIKSIYNNLKPLHTLKVKANESIESQRQNFVNFFREDGSRDNSFNVFRNLIWPIVVESLALKAANRPEGLEEISKLKGFVGEGSDVVEQTKKKSKELDSLLESARSRVSKTEVNQHAGIFSDQADAHEKNAKLWMNAAIKLVVAFAVLILVFFTLVLLFPEVKIELGALAFLTISLVSYSVVQCVRNYNSSKHNQLINRHKANCLESFETFVKSSDPEIREVVMRYTTQTIFAPYNPGYLSKEPVQSPSPIFELLRTVQSGVTKKDA